MKIHSVRIRKTTGGHVYTAYVVVNRFRIPFRRAVDNGDGTFDAATWMAQVEQDAKSVLKP